MNRCKRSILTTAITLVIVGLCSQVFAQQPATETAVDFAGDIRLILPPKIHALPGIETNIYFDNAVLVINAANYAFDITCRRGMQQNQRWTFTPKAEDIGFHPLVLEVRDQHNAIIARASTVIEVVSADAGKDREISLLTMGDSLTNASVYTEQVLRRSQATSFGNPSLSLIGSRVAGLEGVRHEGYGGWTAERFTTKYSGIARGGPYKENGSPFLYKPKDPDGLMLIGDGDPDEAATASLDFGRFCRAFNNGKAPEFVTILLGCNDTFSATDETIESRIDTMLKHYETLLAMIHQFSPDTQIGAMLLAPPAATQDAFGTNYASGQTRWQYKRNQHRVVERMIAQFGDREADNIFLVAAQLNLDTMNNYPTGETPVNAHSETEVSRQKNGVHPGPSGYRQIGDSLYAWLKSRLAE